MRDRPPPLTPTTTRAWELAVRLFRRLKPLSDPYYVLGAALFLAGLGAVVLAGLADHRLLGMDPSAGVGHARPSELSNLAVALVGTRASWLWDTGSTMGDAGLALIVFNVLWKRWMARQTGVGLP